MLNNNKKKLKNRDPQQPVIANPIFNFISKLYIKVRTCVIQVNNTQISTHSK